MMKLKDKGVAILIVFLPFAHESVKYCNNEIRNLCNDFESKLEARRSLLQISLDVFMCLEKVNQSLSIIKNFKIIFCLPY